MVPWRRLSWRQGFNVLPFARYVVLRLFPFPGIRRTGSWLVSRLFAPRFQGRDRPVEQPVIDALTRLDQRGFAEVSPVLDDAQIDEILAYLVSQPAFDGTRELFVRSDTRGVSRARYPVRSIVGCPPLLQAMNSPTVLCIAERFLGCKPTIAALGLHWSFPVERMPEAVQTFHRDIEAALMLNMFVYLTDVDAGSGPHRYVFGSHRTRGRLRLTPYSDDYVHKRYGAEQVHTVVGRRGTTFIENGWGIHEGLPPADKPRLMFSVMYCAGPVSIYDYARIRVTAVHGYDPYVNRLVVAG